MWRFILLLLAGCGCKPPSSYEVRIVDPYAFPWVVEGVTDAAADWSAKTGATLTVEFRADGCGKAGIICIHEHAPWCPCDVDHMGGITYLNVAGEGADVYIDSSLTGDDVQIIARHELGHAMGLEHVSDESAIMYPIPTVTSVSADDVAQWRALR